MKHLKQTNQSYNYWSEGMNKMKKIKSCTQSIIFISILCILLVVFTSFFKVSVLERPYDNSFYFNIVTLNSVIVGFAFTNMGLLLNACSTEVVQKLRKTDVMKHKNDNIQKSISFCVVAMFVALAFMLDLGNLPAKFIPWMYIEVIADGLYLAVIILMIIGMLYFVKSISDVSKLFDEIYKNESTLGNKDIENINNALKKKV